MFTQRIGWLSVVAGGVFALALSLSSVAWGQKGGPPPKPAKAFIESRSNSLSQKDGPPSTQAKDIPGIDIKVNKKPENVMFTAKTDQNGTFAFTDLEPGMYEVVSVSGFPVAAGKTLRYSITIETGWMVPVDGTGPKEDTGPQRKSKNYNSIKSNTSSITKGDKPADVGAPASGNVGKDEPTGPGDPLKGFPVGLGADTPADVGAGTVKQRAPGGGGGPKPTEKYSTTKSNIKNMAFDVSPEGFGQLPVPVEMEIHPVGAEIMISGPGTGVVDPLGGKPGETGYAIKEQGIKKVMPFVVAAPMFLRGCVFIAKATPDLGSPADPATSVDPAANDVPAGIELPKRIKRKP